MSSPLKQDALQGKLDRNEMFRPVHQLPVGNQRNAMNTQQFASYARPVLQEQYRRENCLNQVFSEVSSGPTGMRSEQIRDVLVRGPDPTAAQLQQQNREHEARRAQLPAHQQAQQRSNVIMNDYKSAALVDGRVELSSRQQQQQQHEQYHVQAQQQHLQQQHQQYAGRQPMQAPAEYYQQQPPSSGRGAPQGRPRRLASEGYVPSAAILGADPNYSYLIDRDQKQLEMATDPSLLARAAEVAQVNNTHMQANKRNSRMSSLSFGDHELNPGGHRLNEGQARSDDYGIGRLRTVDPAAREAGQAQSRQVMALLKDVPSNAPFVPQELPHNPYAGKSQLSENIQFSGGAMEPVKYNEFAGKRGQSVVFEGGHGPLNPEIPDGCYIGLGEGGPVAKQNEHAGRRLNSDAMQRHLGDHADAGGREMEQWHDRRRAAMPVGARRIPHTEEVVFGQPLVGNDRNAAPALAEHAGEKGKRAIPESKASQTNVGPRELGGEATAMNPNPPPPREKAKPYADHGDLLHYTEHGDRHRLPPSSYAPYDLGAPPPRHQTQVEQGMTHGAVPPHQHSDEPRGLPRRHPGPERLRRGRGIDGEGHDHNGRQIATSLVDEAVFNRSPMKGQMNHREPGANFLINQAGGFGHR